jgi:uncharacterized protein YlzI (FlbEa/FlbD family)
MITLAELSGLSKSQNNKKIKQANIYQPNSKLMFVGQEHGKKIVINEEIKKAINKYGAWYEGNGDDRIEGIKYQGSWDDKLAKEVRGYPKEFLFVIFTNTAVNKQKEILKGAGNIFDRILRSQKEIGYFKNKRFNSDTLIAFLKQIGGNFLQKSQKEATKENVKMKTINCEVIKVLSEPKKNKIEGDNYCIEFWDLEIMYKVKGYSGEAKTTLTFSNETESKLIGKGYNFVQIV